MALRHQRVPVQDPDLHRLRRLRGHRLGGAGGEAELGAVHRRAGPRTRRYRVGLNLLNVSSYQQKLIIGFIILSAADSQALMPAIVRANEAGVPVILVNDPSSRRPWKPTPVTLGGWRESRV